MVGRGYSWVASNVRIIILMNTLTDCRGLTDCSGGIDCLLWYVQSPPTRIRYQYLSVIVDFPSSATFLTPEERAYLIWKKSVLPGS